MPPQSPGTTATCACWRRGWRPWRAERASVTRSKRWSRRPMRTSTAVDELLERQNYRLAFWRAAREDLGYRRFFDVTTLAGLRIEDERVFGDTHELVLGWVARRAARRPAHRPPRRACATPRTTSASCAGRRRGHGSSWRRSSSQARRSGHLAGRRHHRLRLIGLDHPQLTGAIRRSAAARPYARITGDDRSFDEIAREAKHQVLREVLGSELQPSHRVARCDVCERHRRHRDHTRHDCTRHCAS